MGDSINVLLYTTIGELIKKYREQASLTISHLGILTGLSKGVISKIELGETKRPELKTIKAIATVLAIPYQEIVGYYIEVEQRVEALHELLLEVIEFANIPLVSKVALKLLQSPQGETMATLDRLFQLTEPIKRLDIKLLLYSIIIKYAREHGIPRYIAKGLLQKYLLERQDLKRLEETFKSGEELLHYVDFLSTKERITFYFRLGLHAHNTKKYVQCIHLCETGLKEDKSSNELKARAYLAMINSYLIMGNVEAVENHLPIYESFQYGFVAESSKLTRAIVKARKREYQAAIPMLKQCFQEISAHSRIHVANELLQVYFQMEEMDSIARLLDQESEILSLDATTPYKHSSLGDYYRYKGAYLIKTGKFAEGEASYLQSMLAYGEIRAYEEITECMNEILSHYAARGKVIELHSVQKLSEVYNKICKNKVKIGGEVRL